MQQTLAEKFKLLPEQAAASDDDELFDEEGYVAFVKSRQASLRAEMLDLVFKNGNRRSFAYSHLYEVEFEPSDGVIRLSFSEHIVELKGSTMLEGYRRLLLHRIVQVTEGDEPTQLLCAEAKQPYVSEISVCARIPAGVE
ncbi:MAG: hypothetical protein AB8B50_03935 [Pirellulaceae bacterium]